MTHITGSPTSAVESDQWTAEHPRSKRGFTKSPWIRIIALLLVALLIGAVVWLVVRHTNGSSARRAPANAATIAALESLPKAVGHPVYWAGPKSGYTYELTHTTDGRIYIRYLPTGVAIGAAAPNYLTIGTYPVKGAFATVTAIGKKPGGSLVKVAGGGVAAVDPDHPLSTYLAYPGADYEVEVFDPSAGQSLQLVTSGGLVALGGSSTAATHVAPEAASVGDIHALAALSRHPIYWAGGQSGVTYELSELSDGRIFVRYLPKGVSVGDPRAFQTIGTYPVTDAFAAVTAISQQPGATKLSLPNGGIAAIAPKHPTSVYVAYPGSSLEIEVYAPSPRQALQLVTSGRISAVT
jgi:hypothetical protein